MKKPILLVLILAAGVTAGLYSLPKVVVQTKEKQLGSGTSAPTTKPATANKSVAEPHNAPVSADRQRQLTVLKQQVVTENAARKATATTQLIDLYRSINRYDSAAYYAGLIAKTDPTELNLLRAGDLHFEAFNFAVDDRKAAELGQETRDLYKQVLIKNPQLLAVKANLAMTYVNTPTPMQGIMLLREVLQEDPTNELALFNLGMLSMRSGQYSKAVERFRQILVNNPDNRKAQFYLGVSLVETNQKADSRKVLAQVKANEKDPQILAAVQELEDKLK